MAKRYVGEVIYVKKNYGFLSTIIDNFKVRLFFVVKPEMIDNKNYFISGNKVTFLTRNITLRGTNVVSAYDIKPCEDSKKFCNKIDNYIKYDRFKEYENVLECDIDDEFKDKLINQEKKVALFFMNWILFIEEKTKDIIEEVLKTNDVDSSLFINILINEKKTKKFILDSLDRMKKNTMFRNESDYITYKLKENDPNDVEVCNAPILMLLDQLTINELCTIVEICYNKYHNNLSRDFKALFFYIKNLLPDIIFIRNKVAHGNCVIPSIIDDTFSPSYFYEMASIMPNWNSNENLNDVERYVPFEFIRYQARSLAKGGINLAGIDAGPLGIGLFFTKSLVINQAKKSYFSFAFLIMCIFSYWEDDYFDDFMDEIGYVGLLITDESPETIYSSFPKKQPIRIKLSRILAPIFIYAGTPELFKSFSSISLNFSKTKIDN